MTAQQLSREGKNTDRDLWRNDYHMERLFITEGDGIGMDVAGHVIVLPIRKWHELAKEALPKAPTAGEREDEILGAGGAPLAGDVERHGTQPTEVGGVPTTLREPVAAPTASEGAGISRSIERDVDAIYNHIMGIKLAGSGDLRRVLANILEGLAGDVSNIQGTAHSPVGEEAGPRSSKEERQISNLRVAGSSPAEATNKPSEDPSPDIADSLESRRR